MLDSLPVPARLMIAGKSWGVSAIRVRIEEVRDPGEQRFSLFD
jgi:hypothetical protein